MKQKIIDFINGVMKEMKKVTWPTKDELKDSTTVVITATIILSMFVFVVDAVFSKFMTILMGQ
jgi:preprotein translocase subunit SecE